MADDTSEGYYGALELSDGDGQLLGLLHVGIADLDAPVWSVETTQPINIRDVDPGGATVMACLADRAHPRSGEVAAAHLSFRDGRMTLAGNYGFHPADR